jgi:hypothetical protein
VGDAARFEHAGSREERPRRGLELPEVAEAEGGEREEERDQGPGEHDVAVLEQRGVHAPRGGHAEEADGADGEGGERERERPQKSALRGGRGGRGAHRGGARRRRRAGRDFSNKDGCAYVSHV